MVGPTILKRAQLLVEDTKQKLDEQREIVASLEKRGLDSKAARKLLSVWEETLQRRFAILDQMRTRIHEKRDRK